MLKEAFKIKKQKEISSDHSLNLPKAFEITQTLLFIKSIEWRPILYWSQVNRLKVKMKKLLRQYSTINQ